MGSLSINPKKSVQDIQGLALWLKADAGVSTSSFNYISQIIITGTSDPSFAGTYTANGVPTYNFEYGYPDVYYFTGPAGKTMSWMADDGYFLLNSSETGDCFISYDGVNWTIINSYVSQIVITGFTGIYTVANGTYNLTYSNRWDRVGGGGFFIDEQGLKNNDEILIATPPANYSGSWTPTTYLNSVTLTGAGSTSVNGIYTRTDTEINMFSVQFTLDAERYIYLDQYWFVVDNNNGGALYISSGNEDLISWEVYGDGAPNAPTGSVGGTSARSVGSPTSTASLKPSGSISGSVTNTTANTDFVTAWADQSGQGRNAVEEENDGKKLLVEINGKSFVGFNNTSMILPPISFVGTIFAVVRFNISSTEDYGSRILYQTTDSGDNFQFTRGLNSTNIFYLRSVGDGAFSSVSTNNNTNYLIGATFNSSSASLFLNGTSVGSGPIEENSGAGDLYIGQGEPYKMAEIIVYNRVLTTSERQQVEEYLNHKYEIYNPIPIPIPNTKISIKKTNTGAGKLTYDRNYILNSQFDADNEYPIYDGSMFYDENYNRGGPLQGGNIKILGSYYHNSPLFYVPSTEFDVDYHTFANRTFHEINAPYNILPIGHPIQPRLLKMFGVGSNLGRGENLNSSYTATISSATDIEQATIFNSWAKYGVEQIVAIPPKAKRIKYGVTFLVKSDDNFRLNNFGGLVVYFQKGMSRNYVNFSTIRNDYTDGQIQSYPNLFNGYDKTTNLYRTFHINSNAEHQWLGPNTTVVRARKRLSVSLTNTLNAHPEYLDNLTTLQDTIDIPNFSTTIGNGDAVSGFPEYVSLQMFFAEWLNYLNNDGVQTGSIYYYKPFLYFEY
jgi:hypothetical protein